MTQLPLVIDTEYYNLWMQKCSFLYADDDAAGRQMFQIAIEELRLPVELYCVPDGDQALAFLFQRGEYKAAPRPHLAIVDLYLPKKNAREILSEMRGEESLSEIQIVILTSSRHEVNRRELLALGAADYLVKPPTFDTFLELVTSLYSRFIGESGR